MHVRCLIKYNYDGEKSCDVILIAVVLSDLDVLTSCYAYALIQGLELYFED
jgi:hypothetical protein